MLSGAVEDSRKYSCGVRIAELIVILSFIIGLLDAGFDFALVHGLASSQTNPANGLHRANLNKEAGWLGICTCIALILRVSLTGYLFKTKRKIPQASYRSMLTWFLMFSGPAAFCIEDSTALVIMSKLSLPQIAVPWIDQAAWETSVNATLAAGGRHRRDFGDDEGSGSGGTDDGGANGGARPSEGSGGTDGGANGGANLEESVVGVEQFVFFSSMVGSNLVSGGNWTGIRINHILSTVSAFLSLVGIGWVVILLCGDESSETELDEEGTYVSTDELEMEKAEDFADYIDMDTDNEVFQCCVMLLGFIFIILPAFVLAGVVCMWVWFAAKSVPSGSLGQFADDDVNELGLGLGASLLYQLNPDEISWQTFYRSKAQATENVDFESEPIDIDGLKLGLGFRPLITAYAFGWLFTFFGSFAICCCIDVTAFDPDLDDLDVEDGNLSAPSNASWDTNKWGDDAESGLEDAQEAARAAIASARGGGSGGSDFGNEDTENRLNSAARVDATDMADTSELNQAPSMLSAAALIVDEESSVGGYEGYQLASASPVAGADESAPNTDAGYELASATAETAIDTILPAGVKRTPTVKLNRTDTTASKI